MRVLLLLVLLLTIIADDVADAYCNCPLTTINSVLDDDDDDEHRHHHRPHHECQHEESPHIIHLDGPPQTHHKHGCCCHHHGPYWVSISARNLSDLDYHCLHVLPENDEFPVQGLVEPPFRPPMSKAVSFHQPVLFVFYAALYHGPLSTPR